MAIELGCRCGKVKGSLAPSSCLHVRCWCRSCQEFAAWLEARESGSTKAYVDASGGSEAFQVFRNALRLRSGQDRIVGTKLNPSTNTVRFISTCCNTLLFATLERPSWLPIMPIFSGFVVGKAHRPPFNKPAEYPLLAMYRAKPAENGRRIKDGIHYGFLLRTILRIGWGLLLRKDQPNPAIQAKGGAVIMIRGE